MKLRDLFDDDVMLNPAVAEIEIGGLAVDSRAVKPGDLFFALAGSKTDGTQFIAQAIANGAVAVAGESLADGVRVPLVTLRNARRGLARAAARFYPRQPAIVAAVTGTSGKTSVASFTRQIWQQLGHPAASIGTIGLVTPQRSVYGSLTTPDPVALHRMIDEVAEEGVTHLALEASSHGLDQHRLDGIQFSAGGFTNLSRDHMDYHPDVDHYLAAKMRLFNDLIPPGGVAAISADHEYSKTVIEAAKRRQQLVIGVGRMAHGEHAIGLVQNRVEGFAQVLTLNYHNRDYRVRLPLVGAFQVENALVAAGLAIGTGSDAESVFAALQMLEGASGRLERVAVHNGASIFIDYAHKPDALEKALQALRPYVSGRLIVVFGAGGDRDPGKRPLMGAIARTNADRVIVTDDNPRNENASAIRGAILAEVKKADEIPDRGVAIATAIADLEDGDVLLIAGKGHETGQIIGNRVLPFSDHDAVVAALAAGTA